MKLEKKHLVLLSLNLLAIFGFVLLFLFRPNYNPFFTREHFYDVFTFRQMFLIEMGLFSICGLAAFLGLIMVFFEKFRKKGFVVIGISAGIAILYFLSFSPLSCLVWDCFLTAPNSW